MKPYRCGFCEYRSVKRFNVLLHMRKRHRADATYDHLVKDGEFDWGVPDEHMRMDRYRVAEHPVPGQKELGVIVSESQ